VSAGAGSVHTHVLAWKVDLDIAGTHNSLNMLNFKVGCLAKYLYGFVQASQWLQQIAFTIQRFAMPPLCLHQPAGYHLLLMRVPAGVGLNLAP
jgi:hypothetical protein